ncbi:glucose 1-dehydrogenase [Streptomyces varsoviensis]|uniref:SDR family NAD(P)-dependent oxidoreductase n=1 Tax=Streptomyces varsoviensis TaxID=67373 RepID=UPI0033D40F80
MNEQRFTDRTVLVTGGGRGIGRVLALAFGAEGARVALAARTAEQLHAVAAEAERAGAAALPLVCDVRHEDQVADAVARVEEAYGPVDVLVNCAGAFDMGPTEKFPAERARDLFETNVTGTLLVSQRVAPGMLERARGKIVNFASLLSFTAFPGRAAYAASKGGVLQLTRALALDWAGRGINVNAVAPGMIRIETPHPAVAAGTLRRDDIAARIPAGRPGTPQDVAGAVLFLSSDAADYIHGQALAVDGGWLVNGYV